MSSLHRITTFSVKKTKSQEFAKRSAACIPHIKSLLFPFQKRKPGRSFYLADGTSSLCFSPCLHPVQRPSPSLSASIQEPLEPFDSKMLFCHFVETPRPEGEDAAGEMEPQKGIMSIWDHFLSHCPYVDLDYINEVLSISQQPAGKGFNFLLRCEFSFPFYMDIRWGAYGQIPVAETPCSFL